MWSLKNYARCLPALAVALAVGSAIGSAGAQTLTVSPAVALQDQVLTIQAAGLRPGEPVTLRASLTDGQGAGWEASAQFAADEKGHVDPAVQAALGGSYRGVSAMGLVWSMRPVGGKDVAMYRPPRVSEAQTIEFALLRGETSAAAPAAEAKVKQVAMTPGMDVERLQGDLRGELYLPAGSRAKLPAVLVLGGSEGGMPARRAAWLASHGYAALALAYFHAPGLPDQLRDIPLEYFAKALGWLRERPEVDPQRVAVMGASRGGELALQLGAVIPQIHAVVAFVPANVRVMACCDGRGGAAWTVHGKPLSYATPRDATVGGPAQAQAQLQAAIEVEHTHGPILLIAGRDDGVWPSSAMTQAVVERLKAAHFAYPVERLSYEHAGHRAGNPELMPTWHGEVRQPVSGRPMELGGTPDGDAASTLDAMGKVLAFLERSLAVTPTP